MKICLIERTYNEIGEIIKTRLEHVSCNRVPADMIQKLIDGELVHMHPATNIEKLYFKVPNDSTEPGGDSNEN